MSHVNHSRSLRRATSIVGAAIVVGATSCGGGGGDAPPSPIDLSARESTWSIRVYVGDDTSRTLVDLAPVTEVSGEAATEQVTSSLLSTKSSVDTPDARTNLADDTNFASGWALVWGASVECGMVDGPNRSTAVVPPWNPRGGWYIFPQTPTTCDEQIAKEETLLCIADKLSQVADAVTAQHWDAIGKISVLPAGFPKGPWTIPVQADKDRFIARDLAINVLAHLARLDAKPVPGTPQSCSRIYGGAARDAAFASAVSPYLYGVPTQDGAASPISTTYPPPKLPIVSGNLSKLAVSRLAFETNVLRASGRMLHDLIRRSLYSDLAGAAQRSGAALDALRGNDIAWGNADAANGPYNSLAHAARVLMGRWEVGPYSPDPACGGAPALQLLQQAFSDDASARVEDVPIATAGQEKAAKLVDSAGLVFAQVVTAGPTLSSAARKALKDQLIGEAARAAGMDPADPATVGKLGVQAQSIFALVDDVNDEDLRFAFQRSLRSYRILANEGSSTTSMGVSAGATEVPSGLHVRPYVAPSVTTLGGTALASGGSRNLLPADPVARVAGMFEASQCNETGGGLNGIVADSPVTWPAGVRPADQFERWTFQDSFAIGQEMQRRLTVIANQATAIGSVADLELGARAATAELRTWAGPGRVSMLRYPDGQSDIGGLGLLFTGFDGSELGITSDTDATRQLRLVYGPPWVAECAAGLRTECPASFDADYVLSPNSASLVTDDAVHDILGVTGQVLVVNFPTAVLPPRFDLSLRSTTTNSHLYVVAKRDPRSPGLHGIVLGTLALRSTAPPLRPNVTTSFVYSNMQRELLEAAFALPDGETAHKADIAPDTAATGVGYCVDGLRRDLFVPLENELTSDGDPYENSWRHYLNLAKAAAARADQLGQEYISLGLQRDLRRESASESLADICGDATAMQQLTVSKDAKVSAPPGNDTLKACIGEDKYDLVFLAEDPTLGLSDSDKASFLSTTVLRCADVGSSDPLCKRLADGKAISTYGLQLAKAPKPAKTSSCTQIVRAADSLRLTGFDPDELSGGLAEPFADTDRLRGIAKATRMVLGEDGTWTVLAAGVPVMSSSSTSLWPGCLASKTCDFTNETISTLNNVFRQCTTELARQNLALGGCEAGSGPGELNGLKWRVQGALWLLAAASGGIPEGLVRMPVPVYNGVVPAATQLTFWGPGNFEPNPSVPDTYRLRLASSDLKDQALVLAAPVRNIATAYLGPDKLFPEAPPWMTKVYGSTATPYLHALNASVRAYKTNFVEANKIIGSIAEYDSSTGEGIADRATWAGIAHSAKGLQCNHAWEAPTKGPGWIQGSVGMLKRNVYFPSDRSGILKARGMIVGPDGKPTSAYRTSPAVAPGVYEERIYVDERGGDAANWCKENAYVTGDEPTLSLPSTAWTDDQPQTQLATMSFDERVIQFANSQPSCSPCGAASEMLGALAFACVGQRVSGTTASLASAPDLSTPDDIIKLETWLVAIENAAGEQLGRLYVESVPKRVVEDYKTGVVGSGTKLGAHGDKVGEIEAQLNQLTATWTTLPGELEQIRNAIAGARLRLTGVDISTREKLINLQINEYRAYAQMIQAVGSFVSSIGSGNFVNAAGAGISSSASIDLGIKELGKDKELEDAAKDGSLNSVSQILSDLRGTVIPAWSTVDKTLSSIRAATSQLQVATSQLDRVEQKANYEAAKGAGSDYYLDSSGTPVVLPVNTVLNRQYDAVEARYRKAFQDALRLSYMARRAIEQRIGVTLSEISTKVGPMEAPSGWADKLCRMQGIDYARLRTAAGIDAGAGAPEPQLAGEFADQFVGDYVAQLESFVEYYNVQYPSHDGDDTVVLSLKDDLLSPSNECKFDGPNLLYSSGELSNVGSGVAAIPGPDHRWHLEPCDETKCLDAVSGRALLAPNPKFGTSPSEPKTIPLEPPDVSAHGGVTWLVDRGVGGGDAGADAASSADGGSSVAPHAIVWQQVHVDAGSYVLSWWDEARAADGGLEPAIHTPYQVTVYGSDWVSLAHTAPSAGTASSDGSVLWPVRRTLTFEITESRDVRIAFGASASGAPLGSVAIANVQLEKSAPGGVPGPYFGTDATRAVVSGLCKPRGGADLRAAFDRTCDDKLGCYFELHSPLIIDTQTLTDSASSLQGKLARGNFNFRHIDIAVNLVGTGVRDCSSDPTPTCYGSGYTEYTLLHDATKAGIIDWEETSRKFDFSVGRVEHGKALAAERYLTTPLGGADAALIAQPGVNKTELRGRPLDGTYRLRIWDSSALRWARLEDVQFILHYRYWSRVDRRPISP